MVGIYLIFSWVGIIHYMPSSWYWLLGWSVLEWSVSNLVFQIFKWYSNVVIKSILLAGSHPLLFFSSNFVSSVDFSRELGLQIYPKHINLGPVICTVRTLGWFVWCSIRIWKGITFYFFCLFWLSMDSLTSKFKPLILFLSWIIIIHCTKT